MVEGSDHIHTEPLKYREKEVKELMTIFVEHVDIISIDDPNPNPNHEKIIPKNLTLTITLLTNAVGQERYRS